MDRSLLLVCRSLEGPEGWIQSKEIFPSQRRWACTSITPGRLCSILWMRAASLAQQMPSACTLVVTSVSERCCCEPIKGSVTTISVKPPSSGIKLLAASLWLVLL